MLTVMYGSTSKFMYVYGVLVSSLKCQYSHRSITPRAFDKSKTARGDDAALCRVHMSRTRVVWACPGIHKRLDGARELLVASSPRRRRVLLAFRDQVRNRKLLSFSARKNIMNAWPEHDRILELSILLANFRALAG